MKLNRLKTLDYKQLAIDHGEKVVIALIAVLVATVLYRSNWQGTEKSPTEITEKVEKALQAVEASPWPEKEEKAKNKLGNGDELSEKVAILLSPVSAAGFSIKPFNPPLHPDKTLISTPRWLPVQHLIADSGVAEITLKPGATPLDESFVQRKAKEKEPRGRGRDRARRREAAAPQKKEKKEENNDSLPDEFKPKEGGGNGGGLGNGLGLAGLRRNDKGRDRGRRRDDFPGLQQPQPEPKRVTKPVGRGYHFVAIRGIFPLHDQVNELARAMGLPTTEKALQGMVQLRDFKLRRQTRINRPGVDPWSGPKELVDRDSVMQLLENDVNAYAPETVLDGLLDPHICMPYPDRMVGNWGLMSTHPDIKEFNLSDEEVEQQVSYEWKLLEKVKKEEEQQQGNKPPDKRGWMGVSRNMRALANRAQVGDGVEDVSVREKILKELKAGTGDKDQMNEQLEEFVRTRATAINHYLLFRYLDINVKPGETYRYQVQLVLTNPFHDRRVEEVTDPSIIENPERDTEFSEWTPPVTVKEDAQFYVKRIDNHVGRPSLPYASMDLFQWFASTGTVVNKVLEGIQIGQLVGGRKYAEVLRPDQNVFDNESVLFSSNYSLVDVSPGFQLDPNLHKDLLDDFSKVTSGKRPGVVGPDQALVVDPLGDLRILDGVDQRADYDQTKSHYDLQNKPFEKLRKPDDSDDMFSARGNRRSDKRGEDPRRSKFGGMRRNKGK